ncbi:hypothetical protein [Pseudomonas aeruginosa]|nr:hypothetical protein [Pseudomonas aeruginosa]MBW6123284.1 hypothetical protein [Pseudomonas aeruginosa]
MQAQTLSSSAVKATTTAFIGTALIGYQLQRSPAARIRLEVAADLARHLGQLSDSDAAVIAEQLAKPCRERSTPVNEVSHG